MNWLLFFECQFPSFAQRRRKGGSGPDNNTYTLHKIQLYKGKGDGQKGEFKKEILKI